VCCTAVLSMTADVLKQQLTPAQRGKAYYCCCRLCCCLLVVDRTPGVAAFALLCTNQHRQKNQTSCTK
jgi:hypothetical protein